MGLKLTTDSMHAAPPAPIIAMTPQFRDCRFLESPDVPLSRGLLGCFLLFCAACTKTLLENHYFITCVRCGIRARAACVDVVYAKSLRLSAAARAGKMVILSRFF